MTAPEPLTKYNDLLDTVLLFLQSTAQPMPMELQRLKREARQLMAVNHPVQAYIVLSAIAAIEWNFDELQQLAEKAVMTCGRSPFLLSNLAVSFRNIHRINESFEFAELAYAADPTEWIIVKAYVADLATLGRFTDAIAVAKEHVKRLGAQAGEAAYIAEFLEGVVEGLKAAEVSPGEVAEQLAIAHEVMVEARVRSDVNQYRVDKQPEGNVMVQVDVQIRGSLDDEIRLGAALAPRLAQLPNWNPDKLLVDFRIKSTAAKESVVHAYLPV